MVNVEGTILTEELTQFLGDSYLTLSDEQKQHLQALYITRRKTRLGAYIWWFFNFHYAYFHHWMLCLAFFFTLGALGLWWVIDFFRIPTILNEYNQQMAKELLNVVTVSS